MRKTLVFAVASAAAVGSLFAFSAPAQAASGSCPKESSTGIGFCLYYNSGQAGAYYRWSGNTGGVSNLAGLVYPNNGAGAGQAVKNNSASASYTMGGGCVCSGEYVRVFYNSGYLGNYDTVTSNTDKALVKTYNQNASWSAYSNL
ncbi:hypothetical protein OG322_19305 [Streptomyces sp. NBC_01260]|uniref:Peptidase inhibitor family I36 n=1 Tax=Streptomyces laculatispora TaxID=887464 RepID=A0ABY9I5J8_9ACTN|nr:MULTISPECIES: hypothetical protein [Streptomyces]MCX4771492.1 hypothetical protein [Streptomyces sp. NBC_01285]ROQ81166.1 hypothetical protein EDD95_0717 [Streptomyces sp. CEV 2-1]RPK48205.1 hypothetical protein EES39_10525 [Streptomyces sp. ADI92-24]WLQ42168.1 hypothetical protein P8A22_20725 [Streptomyces laculatispora]